MRFPFASFAVENIQTEIVSSLESLRSLVKKPDDLGLIRDGGGDFSFLQHSQTVHEA
jgi:hypothetical protein